VNALVRPGVAAAPTLFGADAGADLCTMQQGESLSDALKRLSWLWCGSEGDDGGAGDAGDSGPPEASVDAGDATLE
jgi:hypothetical protein